MLEVDQVTSLTSFARNAKAHVKRLKKTGKPEVLTINGEAEVVVQSASSYQRLVDDAELMHSLRVIRRSLEDVKAGRVKPMLDVIESIASKYDIDLA